MAIGKEGIDDVKISSISPSLGGVLALRGKEEKLAESRSSAPKSISVIPVGSSSAVSTPVSSPIVVIVVACGGLTGERRTGAGGGLSMSVSVTTLTDVVLSGATGLWGSGCDSTIKNAFLHIK